MRLVMLVALCGLVLGGQACKTIGSDSDPAAIIGEDDRQLLSDAALSDMVGTILYRDGQHDNIKCTAFYTSANTIMTALHCVDPNQLDRYKFVIANREPIDLKAVVAEHPSADLISLQVSSSSPNHLNFASFDPQAPLRIISFDVGEGRLVEDQGSKLLKAMGNGLLLHELDTVASASGSPVLQQGRVVAVHIGALYDQPLVRDLGDQDNQVESLLKRIEESDDAAAIEKLAAMFQRKEKGSTLLGNLAVSLEERQVADIESLRSRISFESLTGGANDWTIVTMSKQEFEVNNKGPLANHFSQSAKDMLTRAGSIAVRRGYSGLPNHSCALRNSSEFSKRQAKDVPKSGSDFFDFLNRPTIGPKKNQISLVIQPLNPSRFPCGNPYTAGMAPLSFYKSFESKTFIHHLFRIGINAACANKMTTETNRWAGTVAHEMLHNLGQDHDGTTDDPATYKKRYVKEFGHCVAYGLSWNADSLGLTGMNPYTTID